MPRPADHLVRDYLRSSFLTGVFVALPLAITVGALAWLWDRMDGPLCHILGVTGKAGGSWGRTVSAIRNSEYGQLTPPLLGLAALLLGILVLGMAMRSLLGRYLLARAEQFVARVPLVGFLYSSVKQLAEAFAHPDGKTKFQSAVMVQFPAPGSWAIGFVTGPAPAALAGPVRGGPAEELICVFVPTTPLPTQGFTLTLPRAAVRPLALPVDEALKVVISGGILSRSGANGALLAAKER